MKRALVACAFALACNKPDPAQEVAPKENASSVASSAASSASVEAVASVASIAPSASSAPSAVEIAPPPRVPESSLPPTVHGTRLYGRRPIPPPSIRQGTVTVNGHLPLEVIQRIVRQNFGRVRLCYEQGLSTNPTLQGRVAVRYLIDRNGSAKDAADSGSDLPDPAVVQCIVHALEGLAYPPPEDGNVTVVYPLILSPSAT